MLDLITFSNLLFFVLGCLSYLIYSKIKNKNSDSIPEPAKFDRYRFLSCQWRSTSIDSGYYEYKYMDVLRDKELVYKDETESSRTVSSDIFSRFIKYKNEHERLNIQAKEDQENEQ